MANEKKHKQADFRLSGRLGLPKKLPETTIPQKRKVDHGRHLKEITHHSIRIHLLRFSVSIVLIYFRQNTFMKKSPFIYRDK